MSRKSWLIAASVLSVALSFSLISNSPAAADRSTSLEDDSDTTSVPRLLETVKRSGTPEQPRLWFIDKQDKKAIPYSFHQARQFTEGLAPVLIDTQWGYIDLTGDLKIGADYDLAGSFSEGVAPVKIGDKWGYIDREGKKVVEPKFVAADMFKDGLAIALVSKDSPEFPADAQAKLDAILKDPNTPALRKAILAIGSSRQAGFIDKTGKFVVPPIYAAVSPFSDGVSLVWSEKEPKFIDRQGKVKVTPPPCEEVKDFSEELAAIKVKGKWGYINKLGKLVIKPTFDRADNFSSGLAPACIDRKWGFIDKKGNWTIKPTYDSVWEGFTNGVAVCGKDLCPIENCNGEITRIGSQYLLSRKNTDDEFDESTTPMPASYFAYPDFKFGLVNTEGKEVTKLEYDQIYELSDALRAVRSDGKWGFIDNMGNIVIKPKYRIASSFSDGVALVKEGTVKPSSLERNEALLKQTVPAAVNDPRLIEKDIAVCDKALELEPTNAQAFRDRGYFLCRLGQYEKAIDDFNEVVKLVPTSPDGYYWRGMANIELKRFKDALIDFVTSLNFDPARAESHYGAALSLMGLGKYDEALETIDQAIALTNHPFFAKVRGQIYEAMGDFNKALPDLMIGRKAASLEPWVVTKSQAALEADIADNEAKFEKLKNSSDKPHAAFAAATLADSIEALRKLKNKEQKMLEVEDLYKRTVEARRQSLDLAQSGKSDDSTLLIFRAELAESIAQLAAWNLKIRQFKQSEDLYKEALAQAKSIGNATMEADCLCDMGKMYAAQDKNKEARETFNRALALTANTTDSEAKLVRGQILIALASLQMKLKETVEAKTNLDEASKLLSFDVKQGSLPCPPNAPDSATADQYYELALQCKSQGLIEASRDFMKLALKNSPSAQRKVQAERFLEFYMPKSEIDLKLNKLYQMGRAAEARGDYPTAEKMYNSCIGMSPDFEWAFQSLARLKRLAGELGSADKFIKKALSINPDSVEGWLEQARIAKARNDEVGAKEALAKANSLDPDSQLVIFEKKYLISDRATETQTTGSAN